MTTHPVTNLPGPWPITPAQWPERVTSLFVDRGPSPQGCMTCTGEVALVESGFSYELTPTGIVPSKDLLFTRSLEAEAREAETRAPRPPERLPFLEFEALWDRAIRESGEGNNILGGNGVLNIGPEQLNIPRVVATPETLAYYGALLLKVGEKVAFSQEEAYPLFYMNIGTHYVEQFIMTPAGGGFYLEYHCDKPHFHMPIQDGGGSYLLARWSDETEKKLQITAFAIPAGHAVYTRKGAIHCDAALTGSWLVGYDQSEACSTVLLRSGERQTKVAFCE